jgi:hypothetical protein
MELAISVMLIMSCLKQVSREAGLKELKNVPEIEFARTRAHHTERLDQFASKFRDRTLTRVPLKQPPSH